MVSCVMGIEACTKIINTGIGTGGLIPPVDGVKVEDKVINVIAKTRGFDSVKVPVQEINILGYTQNNTFGKTTASINIQMQPGVDSVYYQYRLNITRHIQDVLLGKASNFPLDLYAPTAEDLVYDATLNGRLYIGLNSTTSGSFNALNYPDIGQIRLAGSVADSTKRIRLHIVYSPVTTN